MESRRIFREKEMNKLKYDSAIDNFIGSLRQLFKQMPERQESRAFDSLTSIRQYKKSYEWILANTNHNSKVLDWGCGNGHYSLFLMKFGYEVTSYGFETPEVFVILDNSVKCQYVKATGPTNLPFEENTFDLVVSIGVLEHVREFGGLETASLKEIRRVLKPNGLFYCYHLPNCYSWNEFISRKIGRWSHDYRYTRRDIVSMVKEGALNIVEIGRYGFLPRNIMGSRYLSPLFDIKIVSLIFEAIDTFLGSILKPFSQNWYFVAKNNEIK